MPLFTNHKLLFIHIPKCGGDTINYALKNRGDNPFLFVNDGGVMTNHHSPQHLTWRELLQLGWSTPKGYRVAALVRHPIDRVLSAFRYIHQHRKDLLPYATNATEFLNYYLSDESEATTRFDNHNKSLKEFLTDHTGSIDKSIHIRPLNEVDLWLEELDLPKISIKERRNVTLSSSENLPKFSDKHIEQIKEFYRDDILWFECNFLNKK
jgi:hypothetical protein